MFALIIIPPISHEEETKITQGEHLNNQRVSLSFRRQIILKVPNCGIFEGTVFLFFLNTLWQTSNFGIKIQFVDLNFGAKNNLPFKRQNLWIFTPKIVPNFLIQNWVVPQCVFPQMCHCGVSNLRVGFLVRSQISTPNLLVKNVNTFFDSYVSVRNNIIIIIDNIIEANDASLMNSTC